MCRIRSIRLHPLGGQSDPAQPPPPPPPDSSVSPRSSQNDNLYTLGELAVFALEKPEDNRPVTLGPLSHSSTELMARFHAVRRADKADKSGELTRAWRGEIGDGSSDSRYVLVGGLRRVGFSEDEIAAIVCSRRWWNRYTRRRKPPDAVRMDVERLLGKLAESLLLPVDCSSGVLDGRLPLAARSFTTPR